MENNNQIRIQLTTVIVLMLIVVIIILGILFIIINNNSRENDNAEKAQVEDNKNMAKIDFTDYGKPISFGENVQYRYNKKTQTVIITGLGTVDLTQDYSSEIIGYEESYDEFDHPIYKYTGKLVFPSETKKIVICEGITNIRNPSHRV